MGKLDSQRLIASDPRRENRRKAAITRVGRSRLGGGRLDGGGAFQGVPDARCMGPRDANWR